MAAQPGGPAPPTKTGLGQDELRRNNLSALLTRVHVQGATTRAALTRDLGLNRSTIGALATERFSRLLAHFTDFLDRGPPEAALRRSLGYIARDGATAEGDITTADNGDTLAMHRDPWGLAVQLVTRVEDMIP